MGSLRVVVVVVLFLLVLIALQGFAGPSSIMSSVY